MRLWKQDENAPRTVDNEQWRGWPSSYGKYSLPFWHSRGKKDSPQVRYIFYTHLCICDPKQQLDLAIPQVSQNPTAANVGV